MIVVTMVKEDNWELEKRTKKKDIKKLLTPKCVTKTNVGAFEEIKQSSGYSRIIFLSFNNLYDKD